MAKETPPSSSAGVGPRNDRHGRQGKIPIQSLDWANTAVQVGMSHDFSRVGARLGPSDVDQGILASVLPN
jgi:hypothetical protein